MNILRLMFSSFTECMDKNISVHRSKSNWSEAVYLNSSILSGGTSLQPSSLHDPIIYLLKGSFIANFFGLVLIGIIARWTQLDETKFQILSSLFLQACPARAASLQGGQARGRGQQRGPGADRVRREADLGRVLRQDEPAAGVHREHLPHRLRPVRHPGTEDYR